ncbi:acyl-CoA dehydrogenase [Streptomyces coacervatus]|nr:acyl-CoA dehydrogenase [Streptomyces coacervatus]MDF2266825.1 acyl-CoA dehydrogenase [Streptomyces coacervatus]
MGDPFEPDGVFSYARLARLDERDAFPAEACAALDAAGLPAAYVPVRLGGVLGAYDEALAVIRAVARRDLTVAVAHAKTYLGAVSAWVGADPGQARALAEDVLAGTVVAWGLTEPDHGSDLLAGDVTAVPGPDGYRLHGEKWLINNAGRGQLVCVLARTDPAGGPRGFSLLLADKRRLPHGPGGYRTLPKVRTHGIRGADISGIGFDGATVPSDALIGAEGAGVEIVLKSLQLTRTMCASLSLGAGDHALALTTGFMAQRRLYGRPLAELPQARHSLGEAVADLLCAEAVGVVTSRCLHTLTGEGAVASAAAKYLVPTLAAAAIDRLGQLLGARAFLSGVHAHGMFQKVARDHRIVGLFDGSTVVNLHALVNNFPALARGHRRGTADGEGVAAAADLRTTLPELDTARLSLTARGGSSLVQSLLVEPVEPVGLPPRVALLAARVHAASSALHEELAAHRPSAVRVPSAAFALAERYCALYAAAAALHLWTHNHRWIAATASGPALALWADGLWVEAALLRLLPRILGRPVPSYDTHRIHARLAGLALAPRDPAEPGPVLSLLPRAHPADDPTLRGDTA